MALGCAAIGAALDPTGNSREAIARPAGTIDNASASVEAALAGDYGGAQAMAAASGNPAARKLVEWIFLRQEWKDHDRLMAFVLANPHWPAVETLRRRAERIRLGGQAVQAQFAKQQPETVAGMLALAREALARDDKRAAQQWAGLAWRKLGSDLAVERRVLKEFEPLLSDDDHKHRMWRLICSGETNAAIRAAGRLPVQYRQVAQVARKLIRGGTGVIKAFQRLSSALRAETAMQYALARHYRQNDQYEKAADILLKISSDQSKVLDPQQMWRERELIARPLLERPNPEHWRISYRVVAGHGIEQGVEAAEAEFLAGWIALRFLRDGRSALGHFRRLQSMVTTRTERARAAYWLGRTYEALGQSSAAQDSYRHGARIPTVYYGQLAYEALGEGGTRVVIPDIRPSKVTRNRVANDELVRAYRILASVDRAGERRVFLEALADHFKTEEEMAALAAIVWNTKGAHEALQLAKAASAKGIDIDSWNYPTKAMPRWKEMGPPVERSLVFGLARQESEFNPGAGSRVGARGLMQLMPATAKLIARQYKVDYDQEKLTGDPGYNVMLGAAHLGDLVKKFKGSYLLALAAYNAGPRHAVNWTKRFGDPRQSEVDPVDWIESIPFTETRFYIQKVLQNNQIYRARLGQPAIEGISADLSRGRSAVIARSNDRQSEACGSASKMIDQLVLACR
jgi:soluble lytic murein transglycosylase